MLGRHWSYKEKTANDVSTGQLLTGCDFGEGSPRLSNSISKSIKTIPLSANRTVPPLCSSPAWQCVLVHPHCQSQSPICPPAVPSPSANTGQLGRGGAIPVYKDYRPQKERCSGFCPDYLYVPQSQLALEAAPSTDSGGLTGMAGCHFLSVENRQDQAKQMVPTGAHPKSLLANCAGVFQTHSNYRRGKSGLPATACHGPPSFNAHPGGRFSPSFFGAKDSLSFKASQRPIITDKAPIRVTKICHLGKTTFERRPACRARVVTSPTRSHHKLHAFGQLGATLDRASNASNGN